MDCYDKPPLNAPRLHKLSFLECKPPNLAASIPASIRTLNIDAAPFYCILEALQTYTNVLHITVRYSFQRSKSYPVDMMLPTIQPVSLGVDGEYSTILLRCQSPIHAIVARSYAS